MEWKCFVFRLKKVGKSGINEPWSYFSDTTHDEKSVTQLLASILIPLISNQMMKGNDKLKLP